MNRLLRLMFKNPPTMNRLLRFIFFKTTTMNRLLRLMSKSTHECTRLTSPRPRVVLVRRVQNSFLPTNIGGGNVEALYFPMISNCRPRIPRVKGWIAYTLLCRKECHSFVGPRYTIVVLDEKGKIYTTDGLFLRLMGISTFSL